MESEQDVCAICLVELSDLDYVLKTCPCNHTFHQICIDTHQSRSNACPVCRQPIVENVECINQTLQRLSCGITDVVLASCKLASLKPEQLGDVSLIDKDILQKCTASLRDLFREVPQVSQVLSSLATSTEGNSATPTSGGAQNPFTALLQSITGEGVSTLFNGGVSPLGESGQDFLNLLVSETLGAALADIGTDDIVLEVTTTETIIGHPNETSFSYNTFTPTNARNGRYSGNFFTRRPGVQRSSENNQRDEDDGWQTEEEDDDAETETEGGGLPSEPLD